MPLRFTIQFTKSYSFSSRKYSRRIFTKSNASYNMSRAFDVFKAQEFIHSCLHVVVVFYDCFVKHAAFKPALSDLRWEFIQIFFYCFVFKTTSANLIYISKAMAQDAMGIFQSFCRTSSVLFDVSVSFALSVDNHLLQIKTNSVLQGGPTSWFSCPILVFVKKGDKISIFGA